MQISKNAIKLIKTVPSLPHRATTANKGDCGRVLIIGGSRGMAGAPRLAGRAAYRGGAGLVRVAVPSSIWDITATGLDECLTIGLSQTKIGVFSQRAMKELRTQSEWASVVVMGPGMTQSPETAELIRVLAHEIKSPLLLDADGLNAFRGGKISKLKAAQAQRSLVLTPHPGEMARLLDIPIQNVQADRRGTALKCAQLSGAIVVLKGAGTIVCDEKRLYENTTGNAGMATGGTGDVLSGLIGALLGQGLPTFEAACLGVYLHGLAGDFAVKRLGIWCMVAGDLVDELPNAFLAHAKAMGG
ncbi:MAG: NAD(P)H-hydrate dehydratase [Planctomycetota bacterium]